MCLVAAAPAPLPGAPATPPAPSITWPSGWTVTGDRAQPRDTTRVLMELSRDPGTPADALTAAAARFKDQNTAAGLDVGCGDPAPVQLGAGIGTGLGCTGTRSGLPLVKLSLVAWPQPGGAAVLAYLAGPGAYESHLAAFRATVKTARAGG